MGSKVTFNASASRYEIHVDGELAGFAEVEDEGAAAVFPHTVIEPRFGGQGLGGVLVRHALDDVRAQGRSVVPACSFVERFIEKHPDYQDLLA